MYKNLETHRKTHAHMHIYTQTDISLRIGKLKTSKVKEKILIEMFQLSRIKTCSPSEGIIFLNSFISGLGISCPAISGVFPFGSTDNENVFLGTDSWLSPEGH